MMYRSLAIRLTAIVVISAATAPTVVAQGRGFHGGGGASVFRGAPAVRSAPGPAFFSRPGRPIVANPVAPFVTSPVAPPFRGGPFTFGGSRNFGRFPRPVIVPPVIGYSPYIWPTTIYGYGGPEYYPYPASVYSEPAYTSPVVQAPSVSQGEVDLAYQVGRLSAEIEQLRQQQTIPSSTQPPPQTQAAPQQRTATPTVLVFRDGHRMEIQNYAVVGQTLWVLDERVATKIPISDLDLDATQRENRGSGLRLPSQEK